VPSQIFHHRGFTSFFFIAVPHCVLMVHYVIHRQHLAKTTGKWLTAQINEHCYHNG